MKRFHKPKSGRVKSPPGKVVSRRTDQRAWVFKGSPAPPRALFEALADGESVGEFVKRFPNLQAEEIKNVLRGVVFWLITMAPNGMTFAMTNRWDKIHD